MLYRIRLKAYTEVTLTGRIAVTDFFFKIYKTPSYDVLCIYNNQACLFIYFLSDSFVGFLSSFLSLLFL